MVDNERDNKYLEVMRLIDLLNTFNGDDRAYPNRVGNIMITDANGNYKGFIDFLLTGSIETFDPSE